MIRYKIYQNQQKKGLNAGKWFARAVSDETFDLAKLAEHMSKHNSPYSGGVIKGVLSDMVDCIKELLLDGKAVMLRLSSGVTAIKRSASLTPTSFNPEMEEGEAATVSKSKLALRALSFSSLSSIKIMSCFSRDNSLAKWVPTLPAPAIIIFMSIDKFFYFSQNPFFIHAAQLIQFGN